MICIKCNRQITRSYGTPDLMGNYCEHCATLLGFTPEQMQNSRKVVIHCDITQTFINEYKAEVVNVMVERLKNCFRDNCGYEGSDIKNTIEQIARGIKNERTTF